MAENDQYLRRASLMLVDGEKALDLSEMHFRFKTSQQDEESPNNCMIRVYNLTEDTVKRIRGEYSRVVLQAGYQEAAFGVIFDGTIRQYRQGKEPDNISTYLDILAADGDLAYNFSTISTTVYAGTTAGERVAAVVQSMAPQGVTAGQLLIPSTGGVLPRGKVLFGMARAILRAETQTQGATWNINNGQVNVIPLDGYLPSEAVVLTDQSGLIGRVEQTEDGMRCTALLNPKLIVGGLVKIDNASINKTSAAAGQELPTGQLAYNRYAGVQLLASEAADGLYRIYVAEFVGDTRGEDWYTELVCLSIDPVTMKCKRYG